MDTLKTGFLILILIAVALCLAGVVWNIVHLSRSTAEHDDLSLGPSRGEKIALIVINAIIAVVLVILGGYALYETMHASRSKPPRPEYQTEVEKIAANTMARAGRRAGAAVSKSVPGGPVPIKGMPGMYHHEGRVFADGKSLNGVRRAI